MWREGAQGEGQNLSGQSQVGTEKAGTPLGGQLKLGGCWSPSLDLP